MSSDKPRLLKEYLEEWLARQRVAQAITPEVERARSAAEWEASAYSAIQPYLSPSLRQIHEARVDLAYKRVQALLPMPPPYESFTGTSVSSAVATGTMGTYGFALDLRDMASPPLETVGRIIAAFERLQAAQDRVAAVKTRLNEIAPALAAQFDRAHNEQLTARTQVEREPAAALEIRTLLDNVQGQLFQKARANPGENMTWEIMSARLASPSSRELSCALLLEQKRDRSRLIDDLSALAKRRPGDHARQLSELWPLVLEHLYVLCSNVMQRAA